jgi:lipopolysaccharide/colanic/teichoic acid biosynthesis glycosyltransferase
MAVAWEKVVRSERRRPVGHIPSSKSTIIYRLSSLDVAASLAAPIIALWIRNPIAFFLISPAVVVTYIAISVFFSLLFFVFFRISRSLPNYFSISDAGDIAKATLCAVTSTAALAFTITRLDQIPRSVPAIHFLTLLAILFSLRFFHGKLAQHEESREARAISHDGEKNVIIVGAGALASLYIGFLESIPYGGWRIAAILDDNKWLHGRSILGHTIMGGIQDAEALLDDFAQHGLKITSVIVCDRDRDRAISCRDRLEPLCRSHDVQIELLVERLGVFDSLSAMGNPPARPLILPNAAYFRTKRILELVIASVGVLIFLPVLAFTGLLVLASLGSPVIFWQRRVGRHGRTIFVYKFKTMRNAVDRQGRLLAARDRTTRVGEILRATRLDELPQLLNIIQGDMAIIGPRPLLPIDQPAEPALRLAVAPGLTGWAQINGGKLVSVEEKNALDEWYVQNASPMLDFKIIWRTVATVIWGDRRDENQLAAALARARKDQKRRASTIVGGALEDLSPFVEQNAQRTAR